MLDRRYNDVKSARIKPVTGSDVEPHFREKSAAARRSQRVREPIRFAPECSRYARQEEPFLIVGVIHRQRSPRDCEETAVGGPSAVFDLP